MAYSLDLKGSEYYTIYLRNLDDNKDKKDKIQNTSGSITWALDSKSFFYSKLDINFTDLDKFINMLLVPR